MTVSVAVDVGGLPCVCRMIIANLNSSSSSLLIRRRNDGEGLEGFDSGSCHDQHLTKLMVKVALVLAHLHKVDESVVSCFSGRDRSARGKCVGHNVIQDTLSGVENGK